MSSCRATNAKGRRALARCQLVTLRAVVPVAGSSLPVVERVIALWERELAGDEPTSDEWAEATWAAWAAARSARAESETETAAKSAWAAAWAVAASASWVAWVAKLAWVAESAWVASLAKSAADTIIFGHLAAIREELGT